MTDETTVFITLGSGNEFGISDYNMFIRSTRPDPLGKIKVIDLGPSTRENFRSLIKNMERLECHLKEE